MAIKIDSFGNLSKVEPTGSDYFNVDMLERIVGGWPEPCKIGPIWLIKNEDSEKIFENYNQVASMFFQLPIYGDVMALSALELPPEWDLIDDMDKKYSVEDIDEGFLKSLSLKPTALNIERLGALSAPSTTNDENFCNLTGILVVSDFFFKTFLLATLYQDRIIIYTIEIHVNF